MAWASAWLHVARHLEEDRPLAPPQRDAEGAIGHSRGIRGGQASLPFRDRREQGAKIELLVRHQLVPVHRELAGERDDR
jgi:hypothetical protein